MKNKLVLTVLTAVVGLLLLPLPVFADDDDDKDNKKKNRLNVEPFQFGQGALAGWIAGAGKPGQKGDRGQYGLYLQKGTKTNNFAAAGASLTGKVPKTAAQLTALSFDLPGVPFSTTFGEATGYCNNGSPLFNVYSFIGTAFQGTCFLGCLHGDKTQDPVTGWWTVSFSPPFTQYPGCNVLTGGFPPTGDIQLELNFQEGNDVDIQFIAAPNTGNSPGNVVLDNITVNNRTVGRPDDDRRD